MRFLQGEDQLRKRTVGAVITMYVDDRLKSHAAVICGRFFDAYYPDNKRTEPRHKITSMYVDQFPPNDLSRGLSEKHGFKIVPTIAEALTSGTDKLAVDAVLLIGEHGDYPRNEKGQKLYPRHRLFKEVVDVFRSTGRAVPVFCDKHLSYSWPEARQMYDWSRELKFPLMAGSSIPLTVRRPEIEIPLGTTFEGAVLVGMGDIDAYGFHTLEALQCLIERRGGGEKGIRAVEFLEGDAVWKWRGSDSGRWSVPLLEAALKTNSQTRPGRMEDNAKNPVLFLLEYVDGLRAASYLLQGHATNFLFAGKVKGKEAPVACNFGFTEPGSRPLAHFDGLVYCIEHMFATGKPLYPVERTLLTTGALAFLFESRGKGRIDTPMLNIRYKAPANAYYQRM
jgi:hypothetical protein